MNLFNVVVAPIVTPVHAHGGQVSDVTIVVIIAAALLLCALAVFLMDYFMEYKDFNNFAKRHAYEDGSVIEVDFETLMELIKEHTWTFDGHVLEERIDASNHYIHSELSSWRVTLYDKHYIFASYLDYKKYMRYLKREEKNATKSVKVIKNINKK